ncbi:MAG: DUF1761 domain-containing protein [Ignavibacteria bacterium]|nr:DUF1761 domain-containing protein [Ignavibacteria bacterium]
MENSFQTLNWLAIIAATLLSFIIGAVWYSPVLFGKVWQREAGLSDEQLKNSNMALIFGGALLLIFISVFNLAMFLGPKSDLKFGIIAGFLTGFGWVATSLGVLYLFERKSLKFFFINSTYNIICFTASGAIIGVWK